MCRRSTCAPIVWTRMPALSASSLRPLGVDTDTESIFGTLRSRWWVVPVIFIIVFGLVVLEDPETSIQPGYSRIDREYLVNDNTVPFTLLDLPSEVLAPLPDLDTQLAQLQSTDEFIQLAEQYVGTSLLVSRIVPQLALQPDETSQNVVTLRGRIRPVLSVTCSESTASSCPAALDALAELLQSRHELAMRAGLQALSTTASQLESGSSESTALRERLAAVRFGVQALATQPLTELVLIREFNAEEIETTVTESANYRFALAAAVILSLLVIFQWSVFDKRLYGLRRIARSVGVDRVIGHVRRATDDADVVACAAAVRAASKDATRLRIVRLSGVADELLQTVVARSGVVASTISVSELSVTDLSDTTTSWLIVAQRGASHARELLRASDALAMSTGMRPRVLLIG